MIFLDSVMDSEDYFLYTARSKGYCNPGDICLQGCFQIKIPLLAGFYLFSFLVHGFEASGADLLSFAFDLLALQVYAEFPKGFDIGMADGVSGLGTAAADVAYSAHIFFLWITNSVVDLLQNIR